MEFPYTRWTLFVVQYLCCYTCIMPWVDTQFTIITPQSLQQWCESNIVGLSHIISTIFFYTGLHILVILYSISLVATWYISIEWQRIDNRKIYIYLSHAPCWFSLLIGLQPWNMEPYLTFYVISVRYKDKGTSLMTSQWRFRPPSAFPTATVRPSNTVFIRWFRPD